MATHPKAPATRAEALDWLRGLDDKDFAEVFYEAVAGRCTSDLPAGRGHFLLADTELQEGGHWDLDVIALPVARERTAWSGDAPICQSGSCSACSAKVRSWSKLAECPVCGSEVYCS